MSIKYTDEFLISELHRFVKENGRNPTQKDMNPKNNYPYFDNYRHHFDSFNNSLKIAGLEINQIQYHPKLDGTETCFYCNKKANEIPNFTNWIYDNNDNNKRYCKKHGSGGLRDYVKGELNINSPTGFGRAGEICVIKTLGIDKEFDCNRISCDFKYDLYNEKYGKIDVKTCLFYYKYNCWLFTFNKKQEADTYICLGLSLDRKTVEYVWIVPNESYIKNKKNITVMNTYRSLSNHSKWEVDSKIYNNAWKEMLINYTEGNCKIFGNKNEELTEEEKQIKEEKYQQFKKEFLEKHKR